MRIKDTFSKIYDVCKRKIKSGARRYPVVCVSVLTLAILSTAALLIYNHAIATNPPGNSGENAGTGTGLQSDDPLSTPTITPSTTPSITPSIAASESPSATPAVTPSPADPVNVKVKALYLTGWTAGSASKLDHYIRLANTTEINSYVIDIKDDDGLVGYETAVPGVTSIKAWMKKYDVDKVIKQLHENNIYVIGRIVCFKDPTLPEKRPEFAIKTSTGAIWREKNSDGDLVPWINPYIKDSWDYLIAIAKEAVSKGFDEIQFDYVRFPGGNKKPEPYFGENPGPKHEAINEFLSLARKSIPDAPISADVYGIICESPGDRENIGQYLELIGKDIDCISPMLYPSHYARGQIVNGIAFAKPDLQPYDVVYNALLKAKNRISQADGYKAKVRPYLQDFTASWLGAGYFQEYGPAQVRQQIKATYDAGYEEWILWDSKNTYSESALLPE